MTTPAVSLARVSKNGRHLTKQNVLAVAANWAGARDKRDIAQRIGLNDGGAEEEKGGE